VPGTAFGDAGSGPRARVASTANEQKLTMACDPDRGGLLKLAADPGGRPERKKQKGPCGFAPRADEAGSVLQSEGDGVAEGQDAAGRGRPEVGDLGGPEPCFRKLFEPLV